MTGESYEPGQAEPPRRPGWPSLIVATAVSLLLAVVAVVTQQYAWTIVIAAWTCGWCLWFIWRLKAASRPPAGSG